MSNQDQYGGKPGQTGSQNNDDWDSLTDEQRMQRKEEYRNQNPGQAGDDFGGKPGAFDKSGNLGSSQFGDDFDSLTDDQKIARKNEYAQRDQQSGSAGQTGYGSSATGLKPGDTSPASGQGGFGAEGAGGKAGFGTGSKD